MQEDLVILQFLEVLPEVFQWEVLFDYTWGIPSLLSLLLGGILQVWLFKNRKKTASFWIWLGIVFTVVFCEYGYQAVFGFDAFFFALVEIVLLFSLVGMALGALVYLIWTKIRPS